MGGRRVGSHTAGRTAPFEQTPRQRGGLVAVLGETSEWLRGGSANEPAWRNVEPAGSPPSTTLQRCPWYRAQQVLHWRSQGPERADGLLASRAPVAEQSNTSATGRRTSARSGQSSGAALANWAIEASSLARPRIGHHPSRIVSRRRGRCSNEDDAEVAAAATQAQKSPGSPWRWPSEPAVGSDHIRRDEIIDVHPLAGQQPRPPPRVSPAMLKRRCRRWWRARGWVRGRTRST